VLLDHEVIHWGDPAFDPGFALTHLLGKANHVVPHREAFAEAANRFWQSYEAALGDVPWREGLEHRAVRHTLGCLLARVAGRSPLEYLTEPQRRTQQGTVLSLMRVPPEDIRALVELFTRLVSST
jgi:hypothetical protein